MLKTLSIVATAAIATASLPTLTFAESAMMHNDSMMHHHGMMMHHHSMMMHHHGMMMMHHHSMHHGMMMKKPMHNM